MKLFVIIPKLKEVNEKEIEKSKKAVLNQWGPGVDIKLVVEEGNSYPEIFNKAIDKLSDGFVMFLFPFVILKDRAIEESVLSELITGEKDTLVFGYEMMSFNKSSYVELSNGEYSIKDYLLVLHEHPGDVAYTSLWNKILSINIIKKNGIRFDSGFKENYEYAFLLEYLKYSTGLRLLKKKVATFYTQPQLVLTAKERIIEKKRLFDLYEGILRTEYDQSVADVMLDKERLDYIVYEFSRMAESTFIERREVKKLLKEIVGDVICMSFKDRVFFELRLIKSHMSWFNSFWQTERKYLSKKEDNKKRRRMAFLQKYYCRIRAPFRAVHRRLSKVRYVLLYCESQTMKPHIFDYYNCVKDMPGVRFFIYYPGGWNDEVPSDVTLVKSDSKAVITPWDILILADAKVPLYYTKNEAGIIYTNHGLHMISYDGGDTLYAYDAGKGLFSAMLEPNRSYADILSKEYPGECIKHVGYKKAEAIMDRRRNRKICREKMGFDDETKVVAVFGSWGIDSLFHKVGYSLITQAKEMMKDNYRFVLSIHPKEYSRYDETVEPLGEYVETLKEEGFIIRNPQTSSVDYCIAADLVICDYTTLCEEAMLAGKTVILSDFSMDRVWKHSIIAEYKQIGPSFSNGDNLRTVIENAFQDKELGRQVEELVKDLLPPKGGYRKAVYSITQEVIKNI